MQEIASTRHPPEKLAPAPDFRYRGFMLVELPLDQMTFPEKLQLMELLWDDLTRNPGEYSSPAWHGEVLAECRRRAESGEEHFTDWEAAKEEIRQQVS